MGRAACTRWRARATTAPAALGRVVAGHRLPQTVAGLLAGQGIDDEGAALHGSPIAIWDQQLEDAQVGDPPGHNQLGDRQPTLEQPFAGIPMETPPRLACRAGHHSARWHPPAADPWAAKRPTVARHGVVEELAALTRRAGLILPAGPEATGLVQPRQKAFGALAFQMAVVRLADQGPPDCDHCVWLEPPASGVGGLKDRVGCAALCNF